MDNHNIREIFKSFLKLSKLNFSIKIKASSQDDSELENPESVNLNQVSNKPVLEEETSHGRQPLDEPALLL